MEDKKAIAQALSDTLKLTRQYNDLLRLEYTVDGKGVDREEIVTAYFEHGHKTINVTWDSGAAMVRDIIRALQ